MRHNIPMVEILDPCGELEGPLGDSITRALTHVLWERIRQDAKHGGPDHDDMHDQGDWLQMLEFSLGEACLSETDTELHKAYVEIAALAIAAAESLNRFRVRAGCEDLRHPAGLEAVAKRGLPAACTDGLRPLPKDMVITSDDVGGGP